MEYKIRNWIANDVTFVSIFIGEAFRSFNTKFNSMFFKKFVRRYLSRVFFLCKAFLINFTK